MQRGILHNDPQAQEEVYVQDVLEGKPETLGELVAFADDTFDLLVIPDNSADSALTKLRSDDQAFDAAMLQAGGWVQNGAKKDVVVDLRSWTENARFATLMRGAPELGVVRSAARHLGGMFEARGQFVRELPRRLQAMRVGWLELGRFWFQPLAKS